MAESVKLLVDHGAYENFGDLAMLEAAVERLAAIPGTEVSVQAAPTAWAQPNVRTVGYEVRPPGAMAGRIARRLRLRGAVAGAAERVGREWRDTVLRLAAARSGLPYPLRQGHRITTVSRFCRRFDALFVAGGGDLTDTFPDALWRCCTLVAGFAAQGKPVFLSGQQIGPVAEGPGRALLLAALRRVTYLGVREPGESWRLADLAGVAGSARRVTGDDSLGLAPAAAEEVNRTLARSNLAPGRFVAVNLRLASYAAGEEVLPRVAGLLDDVHRRTGLPMLAVPISVAEGDSDLAAAARLADSLPGAIDFRLPQPDRWSAGLLKGILGAAHGAAGMSYHFATFALSMGVPAVALHTGAYYRQKAVGVSRFWGDARLALDIADIDADTGAAVVSLFDDSRFREQLRDRARRAADDWEDAFRAGVIAPLRVLASEPKGTMAP